MTGIYRVLLIAISAVSLVLSYPIFNMEFLAWFSLVPLFFAAKGLNKKTSFIVFYIFGVVFFLSTMYWLKYVSFLGLFLLVAVLALYSGIFGIFVNIFKPKEWRIREKFIFTFGVSCIWVILEYLRSNLFSGFGWNLLGYSQYLNLPMIQIADVTGVYGVSFAIIMVNAVVYLMVEDLLRSRRCLNALSAVSLLIIMIVFIYGYARLFETQAESRPVRVSVVQGNIAQEYKWDLKFREDIIAKYETLTRAAVNNNPDLIIWPETSLPGFLQEEDLQKRLFALAKDVGVPILVGAPSLPEGDTGACYNSAAMITINDRMAKTYNKLHLVPFGEYVPLEKYSSFLRKFIDKPIGGFSAGSDYTIFDVPPRRMLSQGKASRFGVLICFEDIFSGLVREFKKRDAGFLVNITNDAWFGISSAPYQHAQASVFRAIENRVYVVRAANTGLSCFIDSKGRIEKTVRQKDGREIFIEGHADCDIYPNERITLYTGFGDVFICVSVLLFTACLLLRAKSS